MIGEIIMRTIWACMWIVLICSGLGLIALIAEGEHQRV
jgi:hypothetical protein